MTLRCLLFSSDEGTAAILRQILSTLGIEGDFCSNAVTAAEKITGQPFQIVIIDWDQQPEASLLLTTAQERKAAERPLTLAIVSQDSDAPRALHAGANSLLRKPVIANQVKDTLRTARDLLGSKQGSSTIVAPVVPPAAPAIANSQPASDPNKANLRAGDFLQTPTLTPGVNFETEASLPHLPAEFAMETVSPEKDLEPTAASVVEPEAPPEAIPETAAKPTGTRGLEWYLKHRVGAQSSTAAAAAPAQAPVRSAIANVAPDKPELASYNETAASSNAQHSAGAPNTENRRLAQATAEGRAHEEKKEAELFAYIQGEKPGSSQAQPTTSRFQFARRGIIPALILAAIAIVAAPQAPWHPWLQGSWKNGKQALHAWLNPQPVTPTQAPTAHETFTRAGDEYKLPVAEQIPDATTDPSQIDVVPVVDPTIKKTNPEGGNGMGSDVIPADAAAPATEMQTPGAQSPSAQPAPDPFRPPSEHTQVPTQPTVDVIETATASHVDTAPESKPVLPIPKILPPQPGTQPRPVTPAGSIPPSLKSQLAPANPAIGGNKPLDAAAPPIEPLEVPEGAERALILESPAPLYPVNAKGQQGTVVLQVLIARDGTVQDAKFMQGSLLFARNAIDAVKQWKFKPYSWNGRAVSVRTLLTIRFKPAQ